MEFTTDPFTTIEQRGVDENSVPYTVYFNSSSEKRWIIRGECNKCGECLVGVESESLEWTGTPVGLPNAFIDKRADPIDVPSTPELKDDCPSCVLVGEYLNGD